jgi:hypothetical protein
MCAPSTLRRPGLSAAPAPAIQADKSPFPGCFFRLTGPGGANLMPIIPGTEMERNP